MGPSATCIFFVVVHYAFFFHQCLFLFLFWPCLWACRILVSQPGIKPVFPAVETRSLNHRTSREVPHDASFDEPRYPILLDMAMCWGAQLSRYRVGYYVEICGNCLQAFQCGCPKGHAPANSTGWPAGCPMSSRAPFTDETWGLGPAWTWGWPHSAWTPWS